MAIRLGQSAEADRYKRGSRNYRGPIFGQQQLPQPSMSIPTGGFMGQNQIGGQSAINIYRAPQPELTPEELDAQQLEERAMQYQKDVGKFNLGQKEAELEKRRAEAEEIASGRNMLNGQAVTRAEMDQYQQAVKQSGAKAQADFNRADPFYNRAKQFIAQNEPPPRPQMPGESQEQYSARVQRYAGQQQNRERRTSQVYNQMKENALIRSIQQFKDDPMGYLMGGGMSGQRTNTIDPDELMNYLGQASQLFKATGQEGNFMDYLLGGKSITRLSKFTEPRSRDNQEYQIRDLAKRTGEDPAVTQASIDRMNAEKKNRQLDLDYITMQKYRADVESGRIDDHLNLLEKDKQAARIKLHQEADNLSLSERRNLSKILSAQTLKVNY